MSNKKSYIEKDFEETAKSLGKPELVSSMKKLLADLLSENADATKKEMFHLKAQILPGIAAYKTLCSVMDKDAAYKTVYGYVKRNAEKSRKSFERFLKIPLAYKLIPWMFTKGTKVAFNEEAGFARREIKTSGGVWRIDMTKCPYHDFYLKYGCPELCVPFCDSDDICYTALHPNLVWHREKTLGRGGDCCDFCLKIKGR